MALLYGREIPCFMSNILELSFNVTLVFLFWKYFALETEQSGRKLVSKSLHSSTEMPVSLIFSVLPHPTPSFGASVKISFSSVKTNIKFLVYSKTISIFFRVFLLSFMSVRVTHSSDEHFCTFHPVAPFIFSVKLFEIAIFTSNARGTAQCT